MTRNEFIESLREFKSAIEDHDTEMNVTNLGNYLDAVAAYTTDIQGYYDNVDMKVNADEPTWENFLTILKGAVAYE